MACDGIIISHMRCERNKIFILLRSFGFSRARNDSAASSSPGTKKTAAHIERL